MKSTHTCQFAAWAAVLFAAAVAAVLPAAGATITADNLIIAIMESSRPSYIAEYTVSGTRVQILAEVPPPSNGNTSAAARDLIVGPDNAIYVYHGTLGTILERFDLETNTWSQQTFPGWSTMKNPSGGLDQLGQYIFATDMNDFQNAPQGVVRFDLAGGPTVRFAESIQPMDLSIGPGNVLYALDGSTPLNSTIFKFDAVTFEALGTVTIQSGNNGALAVALDGSIFVGTSAGTISRYSPDGELLASLLVPGARFSDLDIDSSGRIALGSTVTGEVVLTDLSLEAYTRFRVNPGSVTTGVYVSWAVVPEPGTFYVCLGLLAVGAARRRQSAPENRSRLS